MADVLIRGIEMPKECRSCPFHHETYLRTRHVCLANKNEEIEHWDIVDPFCPLVSLPEGHGELIDRKRLDFVPDYKNVRNGIKHIVKETKRDGRTIAGISIELLQQTLVALDELRSVRRYFENAKTIVPAEGGTGNV